MLRPRNASWFELLTAREQLELALRCLADTHEVELQSHSTAKATQLIPRLHAAVDEYRHLAERYAPYWPTPADTHADRERTLEFIPDGALEHLRAWAASAGPLVTRLQQLAHERSQLELLRQLLQADSALPDLKAFINAGPFLASRAYLLAASEPLEIPPVVLTQRIDCGERSFLLAVGAPQGIAALDETLSAHKARRFKLPPQVSTTREGSLEQLNLRAGQISTEYREASSQLEQHNTAHHVSGALADLTFAEWLLEHVPELAVTEHFGWITGWSSAPGHLEPALRRAHVQHVLRFPQPPAGLIKPVVLRNPRWAQPFELFERLLGLPTASEADPSPLLALLAPLMFGFMFADIGQGAVLLITGALLRRQYPALTLLISGGAAAMLFGALFGDLFARADVVPALWLRPLEQPLTPLAVSLAFGAGVLLLGLLLDALQHYWAGQARLWWATRAGLVLSYLGMIGSPLDFRALWAIPVGLAWFWIGSSLQAPAGRLAAFLSSIGEAIETLLQLFVNTLSFVRVGAFALAHAGLATAITALAAGVSSKFLGLILLILGNFAVIVIEGLIVGIQTTRLVLFEFFIRFLRGAGRPFRPLPPPLSAALGREAPSGSLE